MMRASAKYGASSAQADVVALDAGSVARRSGVCGACREFLRTEIAHTCVSSWRGVWGPRLVCACGVRAYRDEVTGRWVWLGAREGRGRLNGTAPYGAARNVQTTATRSAALSCVLRFGHSRRHCLGRAAGAR